MVKLKVKTKDYRLIVRVKYPASAELNTRELDFLAQNNLRGFLKPALVKKRTLEYTGPFGVPLRARMAKPISRYDFLFIMEQLASCARKLQTHSLAWNKTIWDLNSVFINETTKEMQLLYLPMEGVNKSTDIMALIDAVIYSAKPEQGCDTDFVSRFVYYLKSLPFYAPDKIEEYIEKEDSSIVERIRSLDAGENGSLSDVPKDYLEHYTKAPQIVNNGHLTGLLSTQRELGTTVQSAPAFAAQAALEHSDNSMGGNGETGLLTKQRFPLLQRLCNGQAMEVNKPSFRIGKDREHVDFYVSGNEAVSRMHADILTKNGRYFVVDLHSTNKTYVNNYLIPEQVETEIVNGDRLRLGDEEFVFKMS